MVDEDNPSTATQAPAPSPQAAGAMLAQAREKAALSIDTVASQLKLAPRQVRALESGDFASLPGRTFVRGFVRNYARLLDIDTASVLAALPAADDAPGLSHPHLANTHRVMGEIPAEHARRRSFAGWAIGLALVAIIAVAVLYEMLRPPWPPVEPAVADKPAASTPRGLAPAEPAPNAPDGKPLPNPALPAGTGAAPSSGAASGDLDAAAATTDSTAQGAAPETAEAASNPQAPAVKPVGDMANEAVTAAGSSVAGTTTGQIVSNAPASKASTLQIIFRGTSWLDVKDARGVSVLTMTGNEGATRTIDTAPPFDLVVGNADHVDVIFRGARVDLEAHAKQNVARLQLR
jgi:cytoskeleton protein RodZ